MGAWSGDLPAPCRQLSLPELQGQSVLGGQGVAFIFGQLEQKGPSLPLRTDSLALEEESAPHGGAGPHCHPPVGAQGPSSQGIGVEPCDALAVVGVHVWTQGWTVCASYNFLFYPFFDLIRTWI